MEFTKSRGWRGFVGSLGSVGAWVRGWHESNFGVDGVDSMGP